ncbi:MAG: hypothetical protein QOH28_3990 [Actinomycetota bacterium]|nr:hypothetical protein [Actinomycetota bacterium]
MIVFLAATHEDVMRRDEGSDGHTLAGVAVGGLGSIAIAIALTPFRSHIDNANLALILVFVVVCAAIVGGRAAGAVAAVTATLSFDFFLTRPFVSMRIESVDDIETVLILLAVGLVVGEVAARGRRSRRDRERAAEAISRVHRVAERVATGAPLDEVARAVRTELTALLVLRDCWLELAPFQWPLPRLERAGTIESDEHRWHGRGFAMPEYGVQLPVLEGGREVARLVLIGDPDVAVTLEERVVAVALADQLGSAFAVAAPDALARVAEEAPPRE